MKAYINLFKCLAYVFCILCLVRAYGSPLVLCYIRKYLKAYICDVQYEITNCCDYVMAEVQWSLIVNCQITCQYDMCSSYIDCLVLKGSNIQLFLCLFSN